MQHNTSVINADIDLVVEWTLDNDGEISIDQAYIATIKGSGSKQETIVFDNNTINIPFDMIPQETLIDIENGIGDEIQAGEWDE